MSNKMIKTVLLPLIVNYTNKTYHLNITVSELETLMDNDDKLKPKKRKTKLKESDTNTCIWVFKNGKKIDTVCGKPAIEGSQYCKSCINRDAVKKTLINNNNTNQNQSIFNANELNFKVYDEGKNLYLDTKKNFIANIIDDKTFIFVGRLGHDYAPRALLDDECEQLMNEKFDVDKNYQFD
ncbi:MAG TPA: hypothetical protein VLG50_07610 [Candidatus Saccharimonadales bacterium]|nr:hypothetical protein [Candidatus Saccharimonadales bacterium]